MVDGEMLDRIAQAGYDIIASGEQFAVRLPGGLCLPQLFDKRAAAFVAAIAYFERVEAEAVEDT